MIAELTRQLDNMGPVNLDAIQEYAELEERYDFLKTQNNDLTTSKSELLKSSRRSTDLAEQFARRSSRCKRTSAKCSRALRRRAGRPARSRREHPLECGIEIMAQAAGQTAADISLLSGGEDHDRGRAPLRHLHGEAVPSAFSTSWMRRSTNRTSVGSSSCWSVSWTRASSSSSRTTSARSPGRRDLWRDDGGTRGEQIGRHANGERQGRGR